MIKKAVTILAAVFTMVSIMAFPAIAAEKLDTPDGLYWDGVDETYATWDEVENAKQYELYLYRISDSGSKTKVGETKTKKTRYDFSRKFTTEGEYCFKVRALNSSSKYSTSSWSEESEYTYVSEGYAEWVRDGMKKQDPMTSGPGAVKQEGQESAQDQTKAAATATVDATAGQPGWRKNETGWWYSINAEGTTWYSSCWQWLDGNGDGTAECYYFNQDGYMAADTTTPDGYTVNADGAWIVNGVVQTRDAG